MRRFLFLLSLAAALCSAAEPDSVAIYGELVAREDAKAEVAGGIAEMALSGALVGAAVSIFASAAASSTDDVRALVGAYALPAVVGVPLFVHGYIGYSSGKEHAARREAWRDALERRLEREAYGERDSARTGGEGGRDIVEIYRSLIAEESERTDYAANCFGFVVSGLLVGTGIGLAIASNSLENGYAESSSPRESLARLSFLAGLALFAHNALAYKSRREHEALRDSYRDEFEKHLTRKAERRRRATQVLLVPTVDVANAGGGASVVVAF